jgi:DNA repair exonuclease SbcCD ATPase subunit
MYHPDLREELRFLKARLLYKTKKLDEAIASNNDPEKIAQLKQEIKEIEEKLHICETEADADEKSSNEEWQQSHTKGPSSGDER